MSPVWITVPSPHCRLPCPFSSTHTPFIPEIVSRKYRITGGVQFQSKTRETPYPVEELFSAPLWYAKTKVRLILSISRRTIISYWYTSIVIKRTDWKIRIWWPIKRKKLYESYYTDHRTHCNKFQISKLVSTYRSQQCCFHRLIYRIDGAPQCWTEQPFDNLRSPRTWSENGRHRSTYT